MLDSSDQLGARILVRIPPEPYIIRAKKEGSTDTLACSGYNPPPFVIQAAKEALDRVECNQYSPTQGRLRLRKALSSAYSPYFGRTLNPETEIVVTTGANEGMLSAFMGFVEPGHEVIVMEPFFDQYISNIEMAGGKVVYVPLHPPEKGASEVCPASEWRLDLEELMAKVSDKTRMIVRLSNSGILFKAKEFVNADWGGNRFLIHRKGPFVIFDGE